METKPIRIGSWTLDKIREIGMNFGSPSDDAIMRQIVERYERLEIENKSLKTENIQLKEENKKLKGESNTMN